MTSNSDHPTDPYPDRSTNQWAVPARDLPVHGKPEIDQDRAFDLYDLFNKTGLVMFPAQRRIYNQLGRRLTNKSVLEAGCGSGVGTAMLEKTAFQIVGSDKLERNVQLARELYPWIPFTTWDLNKPWQSPSRFQDVVCVEAIEHVSDPFLAIAHLLEALCPGGTLWISTPNGTDKPRPPENPYHVIELTPDEIKDWVLSLHVTGTVDVLSWESFEPVAMDTDVSPLVYRIKK